MLFPLSESTSNYKEWSAERRFENILLRQKVFKSVLYPKLVPDSVGASESCWFQRAYRGKRGDSAD